jgi:hypothetical protein
VSQKILLNVTIELAAVAIALGLLWIYDRI